MKKAITLLFLSTLAAPALADECALVIEGNDAMQYNLKEMSVPATCKRGDGHPEPHRQAACYRHGSQLGAGQHCRLSDRGDCRDERRGRE